MQCIKCGRTTPIQDNTAKGLCPVCDPDQTKEQIKQLRASHAALLTALARDGALADAAISATPTGKYRNRLTELNILRLQAIKEAKELK